MTLGDTILLDRDHRMFDAIARLGSGISLDAAQAELDAMASRLAAEFPDTNQGWGLVARPLRSEVLGDLTSTLWVLAGAVLLVLIIVCLNVTNVLIARSTASGREFAVRAALGAGKRDLVERSLIESLILAVLGWGLGVLLVAWGVSLLRGLLPADIPRAANSGMDGSVLLYAIVLSLGATVLFGSLPALRSMTPNLIEVLKPAGARGSSRASGRRLREVLVVVEVAITIVLLIGAGLLMRSFAPKTPALRQLRQARSRTSRTARILQKIYSQYSI